MTSSYPSDLTALPILDEAHLLAALQARFEAKHIYTYMANVLVAVNPYRDLPLYDLTNYDPRTPHVFGIAHRALQQLHRLDPRTLQHQPQAIICCGESGAGKTVSTKQMMRYLCRGDGVTSQILQANPLLEAFGNAQTLRNRNSSRFAKFIKMHFQQQQIAAAQTEVYLLERSRVMAPPPGEANYHVFYALRHSQYPQRQFKLLGSPAVPATSTVLTDLETSLKQFGLPETELCYLWNILAGILELGEVMIPAESVDEFRVAPPDLPRIKTVGQLWGLDHQVLLKYLETRNLYVRKEVVEVRMSCTEALTNRGALMKLLYVKLFHWLVAFLNQQMSGGLGTLQTSTCWIGILDVFGFESFAINSFEQLCINLANEKLQHFFNQYILESEQTEYAREGIWGVPLGQAKSTCLATLELLESKPSGILSLLDSVCVMPKGQAGIFIDNLRALQPHHPQLKWKKNPTRAPTFTVCHYAEAVEYDASAFLDKNNDCQNPDLVQLFQSSQNVVMRRVFPSSIQAEPKTSRFVSVGRMFQQQLGQLMTTLATTTPYFVRCLNPNARQSAQQFDLDCVKPQIRAGGLLQAVEMLKFGYPCRIPYQTLAQHLAPQLTPRFLKYALVSPVQHRNACEGLLHFLYPPSVAPQYQLGLTKIFFRSDSQALLDELTTKAQQPLSPALGQFIAAWVKKRRMQRLKRGVLTVVHFQRRLRRLRAVEQWRRAVRISVVVYRTFLRRIKHCRPPPVPVLKSIIPPTEVQPILVLSPVKPVVAEIVVLQAEYDTLKAQYEASAMERERLFVEQEQHFLEQQQQLLSQVAEKESEWARLLHLKTEELEAARDKEASLIQKCRAEAEEICQTYRGQLVSSVASLSQHEQVVKDKDRLIQQLRKRIEELERELHIRMKDYQESVIRTYERRLRDQQQTIHQQQRHIRRLTLPS